MICLGIESTAHTFGVGIIDGNKVVANIINAVTTKTGGLLPAKVADHHAEVCSDVINQALEKAGITIKDVDLISFSRSPGIGHTLRIGAFAAISLGKMHKIPVVGVNHCIAHLEIGRLLTKATDPVLLYASGVNTQVIAYEGKKYRIFGETLDIGIGNFLDSFARAIGLGFPGGPAVEKIAKDGKYIELPYTVKGMDVAFGGLLTKLKNIKGQHSKKDLSYSAQETVFAALIEVSERAMAHCQKKELLLGGGVACNKRLQEMAHKMCKARGARSYVLENQYNIDNGAMIAQLGLLMFKHSKRKIFNTTVDPYERTDQIEVYWR